MSVRHFSWFLLIPPRSVSSLRQSSAEFCKFTHELDRVQENCDLAHFQLSIQVFCSARQMFPASHRSLRVQWVNIQSHFLLCSRVWVSSGCENKVCKIVCAGDELSRTYPGMHLHENQTRQLKWVGAPRDLPIKWRPVPCAAAASDPVFHNVTVEPQQTLTVWKWSFIDLMRALPLHSACN